MSDKLILFDFRCKTCNLKFEGLVKQEVRVHPCPDCDSEAKRLISTPKLDPKLESRHNIWVRQNAQKIRQDKKFYENHGVDKKHHSYGS